MSTFRNMAIAAAFAACLADAAVAQTDDHADGDDRAKTALERNAERHERQRRINAQREKAEELGRFRADYFRDLDAEVKTLTAIWCVSQWLHDYVLAAGRIREYNPATGFPLKRKECEADMAGVGVDEYYLRLARKNDSMLPLSLALEALTAQFPDHTARQIWRGDFNHEFLRERIAKAAAELLKHTGAKLDVVAELQAIGTFARAPQQRP